MNIALPLPGRAGTVIGYLLCIILVPFYVNMFPVWRYISATWGRDSFIYLPPLALILLFAFIVFIWSGVRQKDVPIRWKAIAGGTLLCIAGLLIPDPGFPVKRIHVAEYAILSLVARYAMAPFLGGTSLFFHSACFAAILGVHDEFLQGLHPARTYGIQDLVVNSLGSFGGGLIWHGLQLFAQADSKAMTRTDYRFVCWLLVSVLMLIWPALYFKGLTVETWTIVPLLATGVYYGLYQNRFSPGHYHGLSALTAASVMLATYPFITQMPDIVFY